MKGLKVWCGSTETICPVAESSSVDFMLSPSLVTAYHAYALEKGIRVNICMKMAKEQNIYLCSQTTVCMTQRLSLCVQTVNCSLLTVLTSFSISMEQKSASLQQDYLLCKGYVNGLLHYYVV